MRNADYGDVVFPKPYRAAENSWSSRHRYYDSAKNIRKKYTTEIRNILNGYTDRYNDFENYFLEDFIHIKTCMHLNGYELTFKWLNNKRAKKAIRDWKGDPLEVLWHLNRRGLLEGAVKIEQKRRAGK
jgi:hypothetical protein